MKKKLRLLGNLNCLKLNSTTPSNEIVFKEEKEANLHYIEEEIECVRFIADMHLTEIGFE